MGSLLTLLTQYFRAGKCPLYWNREVLHGRSMSGSGQVRSGLGLGRIPLPHGSQVSAQERFWEVEYIYRSEMHVDFPDSLTFQSIPPLLPSSVTSGVTLHSQTYLAVCVGKKDLWEERIKLWTVRPDRACLPLSWYLHSPSLPASLSWHPHSPSLPIPPLC